MRKKSTKSEAAVTPEEARKKRAEELYKKGMQFNSIKKDWINNSDYIDESELFLKVAKALENDKKDRPSVYWHAIETHIVYDTHLASMLLCKFAASHPEDYEKAVREVADDFDVETRLLIRNFQGKVKEKKAKESVLQLIEKHKAWDEALENWKKMKEGNSEHDQSN